MAISLDECIIQGPQRDYNDIPVTISRADYENLIRFRILKKYIESRGKEYLHDDTIRMIVGYQAPEEKPEVQQAEQEVAS